MSVNRMQYEESNMNERFEWDIQWNTEWSRPVEPDEDETKEVDDDAPL